MDLKKQRNAYMQPLNHNIIKSYAKINLALSINYKRSDGYHDISSIMQEIDLFDSLEISLNHTNHININY